VGKPPDVWGGDPGREGLREKETKNLKLCAEHRV